MIRWRENNNLGNGPYPIDMDSPAASQAIGFFEGRHVSVLRPRAPLPKQNESHAHVHDSYEFTIPYRLIRYSPDRFVPLRIDI